MANRKTIGKKRRKVYVVRQRRANLTPFLIGGGALLVLYFMNRNTAAPSSVSVTAPVDTTGPVLTTSTTPEIVDDGSGTGTNVIQPKPLQPSSSEPNPALKVQADQIRQSMIYYYQYSNPDIIAAVKQMTNQEVIDTWAYFGTYYIYGKQLYRYPDPAHPGQWSTDLYDAIQVIRAKYHIF